MELIALFAPCLLLFIFIVSFILLFVHKWRWGVCGLIFCACVNLWTYCLAISPPSFHNESKTLKVMSFNSNLTAKNENVLELRARTIELIKSRTPDIVFLTENFIKKEDSVWLELKKIYPYCISKYSYVGNSVYSKFPIYVDTLFQEKDVPYGINHCKISYKNCYIDIFGCHLSSNNYNENMEYMTPDSVNNRHEIRSYLKNILAAGKHRQLEARGIIDFHDKSKPTIIMGDFNDVCGSPTLRLFENAGFKDAWWEGGFGYGATIHHPLPYRIDHIMYNDKLKLRSIRKIDAEGISDHDALVAEFSLR